MKHAPVECCGKPRTSKYCPDCGGDLAPGYGGCGRCGTPWLFVDGHDTPYDLRHGCFPLCEACWEELAIPEARLPYYRDLILDVWKQPETWSAVEASVLAGH